MERYKAYLGEYDNSMRAQLYDPETNKFEYTGRLKIRAHAFKKALLQDGRVFLIARRTGEAQIYNPETGEFSIAPKLPKGGAGKVVPLDNGNLLIAGGFYTIYNPNTNSYSQQKEYSKALTSEWVKLKDGRVLFIAGQGSDLNIEKIKNPPKELKPAKNMQVYTYECLRYNAMTIKIYDPIKDEISIVGNLAIPRGRADYFALNVLKDGRVLITGGEKDIEKHKLGDRIKTMKDAEIFDPNTGQSKLINKMNYKRLKPYSKLLNDGRVLLYRDKNIELYIPKKYIK